MHKKFNLHVITSYEAATAGNRRLTQWGDFHLFLWLFLNQTMIFSSPQQPLSREKYKM